ncbi:MAG: 50S ribosomal protein L13 [Spirochaetia bacterium]|nr:50S ribosomal protein L13 [Spirochaetia bacterium]
MSTTLTRIEDVHRKWYIIDAEDKVLGRIATKAADIIRGKNKATYTPNVDTGDFVIIINADKVKLTGKKADKKIYRSHTLYPGGLKEATFKQLMADDSTKVITMAVQGMVPKTKLGDKIMRKLRVFKGSEHTHVSQKPIVVK